MTAAAAAAAELFVSRKLSITVVFQVAGRLMLLLLLQLPELPLFIVSVPRAIVDTMDCDRHLLI